MSERRREPHIANEESRRVSYLKQKSRVSITWDRLLYNVRYVGRHWKDRIFVKTAAIVLIYTVGLYAFIRTYYGNKHPLNRYQWRRMKKNGELSEEVLQKEEIIKNYMKAPFNRIHDKEPVYSLRKQGRPGAL